MTDGQSAIGADDFVPNAAPRLALTGITKIYPSVVANENVDLTVMPGEIHAVLGENGAGKSTLMKMIYGVVHPDRGEMRWEGNPVTVANPAHARELGIGMVFQHFMLFETLSVVENVALALPGKPDLAELAERIRKVSEKYGLPVDPRRNVHSLSVGERQRVEIIRCLLQSPKLLIMDEPTSVLTPQAVRKLFETLRKLAAEGCSILYISHKLDEIQELCHTATVLRAGKVTGHCVPAQETPKSMARLMIGKDLRLEVRSGEIVGIAGVSGNGQQELLYALSGEAPLAEKFPVRICGFDSGRMAPGRRRRLQQKLGNRVHVAHGVEEEDAEALDRILAEGSKHEHSTHQRQRDGDRRRRVAHRIRRFGARLKLPHALPPPSLARPATFRSSTRRFPRRWFSMRASRATACPWRSRRSGRRSRRARPVPRR